MVDHFYFYIILAVTVFLRYHVDKQTDHTNAGRNPSTATAVSMGNNEADIMMNRTSVYW